MAGNAAGRYIPSIEPDSGASTKILTDAPLRRKPIIRFTIDGSEGDRENDIYIIRPFIAQVTLENYRDE